MAEGRMDHDWGIASSQMALLAELNRDRKRRTSAFKPDDFNPRAKRSRGGDIECDITILRDIFVPNAAKEKHA